MSWRGFYELEAIDEREARKAERLANMTPEEKQARELKIANKKREQKENLKKRRTLVKKGLTHGQVDRLISKNAKWSRLSLDQLLSMNEKDLQTELRKRWTGRNDALSMDVIFKSNLK